MTTSHYAADAATIADVLKFRAATTPDELAYLFLIDGEVEGPRLTYAGTDTAARAIAAALRDVAEPGDRALLLFDPGIDFIPALFGCQYSGIIPVPVCPPRLDRLVQSWQTLSMSSPTVSPRCADDQRSGGESGKGFANSPGGSCTPLARHRSNRLIPRSELEGTASRCRGDRSLAIHIRFDRNAQGRDGVASQLDAQRAMIEAALEHVGPGLGVCWMLVSRFRVDRRRVAGRISRRSRRWS